MALPGRHGSSDSYRYGFQGQEKDDEIKDEGNSINFKFRMYDPRLGRFFALDPLIHKYPWYSPYQFSGNKVIQFAELEGLEEFRRLTNKDWMARFFKVRPGDNLTVISEVTGVAVNDIIGFNPGIQDDPNHIEAGQILTLRDISGLSVQDFIIPKTSTFASRTKEFIVELATTNENGPSIQSQTEAVLIAEGVASIPSLYRGARGLAGIVRKGKSKPVKVDPDLSVEDGSRKISAIDDAATTKTYSIKYLRQKAVKQAWKDEKALIEATGRGTRDWTKGEKQQILNNGKVKLCPLCRILLFCRSVIIIPVIMYVHIPERSLYSISIVWQFGKFLDYSSFYQ